MMVLFVLKRLREACLILLSEVFAAFCFSWYWVRPSTAVDH